MVKNRDTGMLAAIGEGNLAASGKTRITIRLDRELLDWFRSQAQAKGGSYQAMINNALREHVSQGGESLESVLRRVIREELKNVGPEGEADFIPRGRL